MGSGGVPGDVGAWGAGGGAVRGGRSAAVPGAWAGDVAHGALILEISFGDIARLRVAAARSQACMGMGGGLPVMRGPLFCSCSCVLFANI